MDKIEKIRKEIERQMKFYDEKEREVLDDPKQFTYALFYQGHQKMCAKLLSFLDALSEEPDKGLDVTDFCKPIDPGIAQCVADHWWEMLDSKEPDKSLEEAAEEGANEYYVDNGCSPFPNTEKASYISGFIAGAEWKKNALLEWARERYKSTISNVGCYTGHSVWAEVIEKLESL